MTGAPQRPDGGSAATGWLEIRRGEGPLLLSLPHTGTEMPDEAMEGLVSIPRALRDTDWWIDRLYDFAEDLGATVIRTALSRSVVDVNRDPSGASLYPGQATTGLCPLTTFDGEPLYRPGAEPDAAEVARRHAACFEPYHAALEAEIRRLRTRHPHILIYDAHSIRSRVPRLFAGELPVLNIGTNGGASADPGVRALADERCRASGFSTVLDGRFRGGWITRAHGRPERGVHAVQMEIACRGYMEERDADAPADYDPERAASLRAVLEGLLADLRDYVAAKA